MPHEEHTYFFSYARAHSEFVLKLATDLRDAGANVWLDQFDILGGQHRDTAVEAALTSCEGVLAVISPEAIASKNVMDEVSVRAGERQSSDTGPVPRLRNYIRLRRLHHIDFTGDGQQAYDQLKRSYI